MLAEIPHDIKESQGLWTHFDHIIPQCDPFDVRFYTSMQCRRQSADCHCVTVYGRRLTEETNLKQFMLNCTYVREVISKKIDEILFRNKSIPLLWPKFNLSNIIEKSFEHDSDEIIVILGNGNPIYFNNVHL